MRIVRMAMLQLYMQLYDYYIGYKFNELIMCNYNKEYTKDCLHGTCYKMDEDQQQNYFGVSNQETLVLVKN
jgi:hypothetical protein